MEALEHALQIFRLVPIAPAYALFNFYSGSLALQTVGRTFFEVVRTTIPKTPCGARHRLKTRHWRFIRRHLFGLGPITHGQLVLSLPDCMVSMGAGITCSPPPLPCLPRSRAGPNRVDAVTVTVTRAGRHASHVPHRLSGCHSDRQIAGGAAAGPDHEAWVRRDNADRARLARAPQPAR
jgi:hypothetical protein